MKFTCHLFLIFSISFALVTSETAPSISETCNKDCTLADNLPCKILSSDTGCPLDDHYSATLWPGPPDDFDIYNLTYDIIDNTCLARLWFQWTVPNDSSGKAVRGFELEVISMAGTYVNERVCAIFNISGAEWTDKDIISRRPYTYNCVLVSPGVYYASIYSLPKPSSGAKDKRRMIDRFIVPKAYVVSGTCIVPIRTVTTRHHTYQTTTMYPILPTLPPLNAVKNNTKQNMKWLGMAIGLVGGVLVVLLVTMAIYCRHQHCKRNNDNNERYVPMDSDDEDIEGYRPPSLNWPDSYLSTHNQPQMGQIIPCPHHCNEDTYPTITTTNDSGVGDYMPEYCPDPPAERQPAYKAPMSYDETSSVISEEVWKINYRQPHPSLMNQTQLPTRNTNPRNLSHQQDFMNGAITQQGRTCLIPPRDVDVQSDKMSCVVSSLNQPM